MQLVQYFGRRRAAVCLFIAVILAAFMLMDIFDVHLNEHLKTWSQDGAQVALDSYRCNLAKPTFTEITRPFSALMLLSCGDLLERIQLFNIALERFRSQRLMTIAKTEDWNFSAPVQLRLLAEWKENFLTELSNHSQVTTVILPWLRSPFQKETDWSSLAESSNLLIQEYYELTATDPLCTWIETPGSVGFSFDVISNWTCNRNVTRGALPTSISLLALNAKPPYNGYYFPSIFPDHFFTELPRILHSLYIIRSGIANGMGDVFFRNAKIVPYACFPDVKLNPPINVENIPLYKEVFIIAQPFGTFTYHRLAEVTPRIAVLIDFLVRNPTIMILAPENRGRLVELLKVLGIKSERIISGWCRAEIIYLPRATTCCYPHFLETQVLSLHYRQFLKKNYPRVNRNKVIFIRRTGNRFFYNQTAIEKVTEMAANAYNLSYEVYKDGPSPSLVDTMRMFNAAVMVVSPHGAGFANLVFSEPGTFVIEGVCNRPHAHLFFQRTSQVLGHRWHGIPSSGGCVAGVIGVVTIDPSIINSTIRTYLDLWNALTSRTASV